MCALQRCDWPGSALRIASPPPATRPPQSLCGLSGFPSHRKSEASTSAYTGMLRCRPLPPPSPSMPPQAFCTANPCTHPVLQVATSYRSLTLSANLSHLVSPSVVASFVHPYHSVCSQPFATAWFHIIAISSSLTPVDKGARMASSSATSPGGSEFSGGARKTSLSRLGGPLRVHEDVPSSSWLFARRDSITCSSRNASQSTPYTSSSSADRLLS